MRVKKFCKFLECFIFKRFLRQLFRFSTRFFYRAADEKQPLITTPHPYLLTGGSYKSPSIQITPFFKISFFVGLSNIFSSLFLCLNYKFLLHSHPNILFSSSFLEKLSRRFLWFTDSICPFMQMVIYWLSFPKPIRSGSQIISHKQFLKHLVVFIVI